MVKIVFILWRCGQAPKHYNLQVHSTKNLKTSKEIDDGLVFETTGMRDRSLNSDSYKINLYYPVLKSFLSELKQHFTNKNKDIMWTLQACCPILTSAICSPSLLHTTSTEIRKKVAKHTLAGKELKDISDVFMESAHLKLAFKAENDLLQCWHRLSEICRSFKLAGKMHIKSYLWSSMSEKKTNRYGNSINWTGPCRQNNIVEEFTTKNRRIILR